MRIRSPSVTRIVGPGILPLYVHAGNSMPGTTSIFLLSATILYSRKVCPLGSVETVLFMIHLSNCARQIAMIALLHSMRGVHIVVFMDMFLFVLLCKCCGA